MNSKWIKTRQLAPGDAIVIAGFRLVYQYAPDEEQPPMSWATSCRGWGRGVGAKAAEGRCTACGRGVAARARSRKEPGTILSNHPARPCGGTP